MCMLLLTKPVIKKETKARNYQNRVQCDLWEDNLGIVLAE